MYTLWLRASLPAAPQVVRQAGRIDLVVNNAGIAGGGPVVETDLGFARRMFGRPEHARFQSTCRSLVPHGCIFQPPEPRVLTYICSIAAYGKKPGGTPGQSLITTP